MFPTWLDAQELDAPEQSTVLHYKTVGRSDAIAGPCSTQVQKLRLAVLADAQKEQRLLLVALACAQGAADINETGRQVVSLAAGIFPAALPCRSN